MVSAVAIGLAHSFVQETIADWTPLDIPILTAEAAVPS
jgi:hypothetical protein